MADFRKLTREEYESLKPYDFELQAARSNYLRAVGKEGTALLHTLYKSITGEDFERTDLCGSCELRLQSIIAAWYFEAAELYPAPVKAKTDKTPAATKASIAAKKAAKAGTE